MQIEVIKSKGQWYFRFKAANNEVLCHSEKYKSKAKAYKAVNLIVTQIVLAEVVYIDKDKKKKPAKK